MYHIHICEIWFRTLLSEILIFYDSLSKYPCKLLLLVRQGLEGYFGECFSAEPTYDRMYLKSLSALEEESITHRYSYIFFAEINVLKSKKSTKPPIYPSSNSITERLINQNRKTSTNCNYARMRLIFISSEKARLKQKKEISTKSHLASNSIISFSTCVHSEEPGPYNSHEFVCLP